MSASGWTYYGKHDSKIQVVERRIQTWDATWSVNETKLTSEEKGRIWTIALSPSGKLIVTVPWGVENIYLRDVLNGEIVKTKKTGGLVNSVSFSPINDQLIAFGSNDGKVRVWDVTHDKSVTIGNHKDLQLHFHPRMKRTSLRDPMTRQFVFGTSGIENWELDH